MFTLFVAKKYFLSRRIRNIINLISGISILSVAVGAAALIIILSVFNGIDNLVQTLMNTFDPDLKIEVKLGKDFNYKGFTDKLKKVDNIQSFSYTLEENALLQYGNRKFVGTIIGVDSVFKDVSGIDTMLLDGKFELAKSHDSQRVLYNAVLGSGVAYRLSVGLNSLRALQVWIPRANQKFSINPADLFNKMSIRPIGVFSVQQDYDVKYVIVPLKFAQELLEKPMRSSAIFVKLKDQTKIQQTQNELKAILGNGFKISDRFQQHKTLYKMMLSEKKMIFIIFIFVLLIASFSGIGAVSMLILDKRHDIFILSSMGAKKQTIRNIFALNSSMIFLFGALVGVVIGAFVAFIQQKFGLIGLPQSGTFIIDAYPVKILFSDVVNIFLSVSLIGVILSWMSSNILVSKLVNRMNTNIKS